ncbi:two-component sensor histidine kinase [Dyadobacter crusticola]|uniref:two-component sensor histidine kinase n=1 Tax=Dyadobacter crusticola TaxID=292407 RepID=UPI0004E0F82D|nr:two-component sensor histidine kinase [Dyadobacter crusticola]
MLSVGTDGALHADQLLKGFDLREHSIISVFYEQKAGHLFLGSHTNGLYVIKRRVFQPMTSELSNNVFYGQTLADGNSIVTATGIRFSRDPKTGQAISKRLPAIAKANSWGGYSVIKDRVGHFWTKKAGTLFCLDSTGVKKLKSWTLSGPITLLYQDTQDRIWMGTNNLGLYYIDPFADQPVPRQFETSKLRDISWLERQHEDWLWIGTGYGLFKLDLRNGKLTKIEELHDFYIRSIHVPQVGEEVWITTYADGFFLLKNGKLTRFPLDKDGYLASSHCIFEDRNGFFWVTTNKGLFQIQRADLLKYAAKPFPIYYHYYSKGAGFNTNEFNGGCQPCAVRMENGFISLPSINGLVWFAPEQIKPEVPSQPINIDELIVDNKLVALDKREVIVPAGRPQMDVKINTAYFGDPYNLHLSYRVYKDEKPLTQWKDIDRTLKFSIPFTGGGSYRLCIRKITGFGHKNQLYKNITLQVEKQWFETWLFFISMVFATVLLIAIAVRMRLHRVQMRNHELEKQIGERTSELQVALVELESSQSQLLKQIHLQSHMMASIAHDVRTPLHAAIQVSQHMKKLIRQNQNEHALAMAENIQDVMVRVKDTLESLLTYVKLAIYKREMKKDLVDLHQLLERNFKLYANSGKIHPNTFINEIPVGTMSRSVPQLLDIVVHNIVDNANKYTDAGTVRAYIQHAPASIILVIEDSGYGIPVPAMEWLNATEASTLPVASTGIGLVIIKELAPFAVNNLHVKLLSPGTAFYLDLATGE